MAKLSPRLIPDGVRAYAKWCNGGLSGITFQGRYPADDEKLIPYLTAVDRGKYSLAIKRLAYAMASFPVRLWHPYAQSQVMHLFRCGVNPDLPRAYRDRANDALVELIESWVAGMGYLVKIERARRQRGQTPNLFSRIDEREGFLPTPEAMAERRAADIFRELYEDLMTRLKPMSWKAWRTEYRATNSKGQAYVLAEVADGLKPELRKFLRDHKNTADLPTDVALQTMVRTALMVSKGRNPRERFAQEYLGSFDFIVGGTSLRTSPSLIKSTIRTLAKRRKRT